MLDTLKTSMTSTGTILINIWEIVPETLGMILIIVNIVYILMKMKRLPKK